MRCPAPARAGDAHYSLAARTTAEVPSAVPTIPSIERTKVPVPSRRNIDVTSGPGRGRRGRAFTSFTSFTSAVRPQDSVRGEGALPPVAAVARPYMARKSLSTFWNSVSWRTAGTSRHIISRHHGPGLLMTVDQVLMDTQIANGNRLFTPLCATPYLILP